MRTIISLLNKTFFLEIGFDKYILNVDFENSPETISEATIVDKKGI